MKPRQMTLCAFFTILYILGAKLTIPTGMIPLTLQTMMVVLAGLLLQPKEILLSYGTYLLMGLIGLPVFATGGGISYILQPSFGFLLAFPLAACMLSLLHAAIQKKRFLILFISCLAALCLIYTFGCLYMYAILNFYSGIQINIPGVLSLGVTPFFLYDSISMAIACFCAMRLSQIRQVSKI